MRLYYIWSAREQINGATFTIEMNILLLPSFIAINIKNMPASIFPLSFHFQPYNPTANVIVL
ncbi:hypothetical protein HMPREF0758_1394 [Serratia odorifera DSM 4582]|uniref:Uncharacterized protein n=1 Tax=Serratia odorifera DSM 4582 TaxID=667129 RepID=D4DZP4_SEROD|nr:hypothetical protein HMPREF0758_1394 [Serratia odorifera DSM 4582]